MSITVGQIKIVCPPMLVRNTGWLPTSDRLAQSLKCSWSAVLWGQTWTGEITFAETRIRWQSPGRWLADPVVAEGPGIRIEYDAEPIIRKGRLMEAQPIDNVLQASWVEVGGKRFYVRAPLPSALADPGPLFGLFSYTVRQVEIDGEIL